MSTPHPMLRIQGLTKNFGGLSVIRDVSFDVATGSRTALIGPNGAGKTTMFNLISGVYGVDQGRVELDGQDITALASRRRIRQGLARNFQNIRLMNHLSVLENLLVGQHAHCRPIRDLLVPYGFFPGHPWRRQAMDALAENGLDQYARQTVQSLPYGVRKRIDLVRATMARPKLLLLDEPAAGLNPAETEDLRQHLDRMSQTGLTILVVEHDMKFIQSLCGHVVVLNFGEKIAEGTLDQVRADDKVRAAYLGDEDDAPHPGQEKTA